jgi:hypothetical protein
LIKIVLKAGEDLSNTQMNKKPATGRRTPKQNGETENFAAFGFVRQVQPDGSFDFRGEGLAGCGKREFTTKTPRH